MGEESRVYRGNEVPAATLDNNLQRPLPHARPNKPDTGCRRFKHHVGPTLSPVTLTEPLYQKVDVRQEIIEIPAKRHRHEPMVQAQVGDELLQLRMLGALAGDAELDIRA